MEHNFKLEWVFSCSTLSGFNGVTFAYYTARKKNKEKKTSNDEQLITARQQRRVPYKRIKCKLSLNYSTFLVSFSLSSVLFPYFVSFSIAWHVYLLIAKAYIELRDSAKNASDIGAQLWFHKKKKKKEKGRNKIRATA